jgi:hypothetical protein
VVGVDCSERKVLMAGGWLVQEKSIAGWWLINQTDRVVPDVRGLQQDLAFLSYNENALH